MKECYLAPQVQLIVLASHDLIRTSDEVRDPYGEDRVWEI